MKVVCKTCCGIDVHKSFLVATIIKTTDGIQPSYRKERFSTFNGDIHHFKRWLLDNNCHDVCMELTGKYWIPVFNILETQLNATIANPKWSKAVKDNKDDTKDSKWIGVLFLLGLIPGNFIFDKPIHILREYTLCRFKLVSCNRNKKNRCQNAFTVCNAVLDSVVSDKFGKSASVIRDYLVKKDSFDSNIYKSFLQRSLKKKADAVIASVEGYQVEASQKERIFLIRSHMEFVEKELWTLNAKPDGLVAPYESAISLLCTVSGVDRASAITILSETALICHNSTLPNTYVAGRS